MHARPVLALVTVAALVPALALLSACGSAKANASTMPTTDPNAPLQTVSAPTGMAPTAPAPTGTVMTGTGSATPIVPMAAAVVQPILVQMGQAEAQGGQPDGSPFAGQFAAGQTLEQVINIKGYGCYTIVGASVGIQQLDIALVWQAAPQMQPMTVASSNTTGPNATLGGKTTGCWKNPTPLAGTAKVVMRATTGAGLAAAQVFSK